MRATAHGQRLFVGYRTHGTLLPPDWSHELIWPRPVTL
jgi:hypothetical protein